MFQQHNKKEKNQAEQNWQNKKNGLYFNYNNEDIKMNISFDELITKLRNLLTINEWSHFTEGKTINPEIWTQVNNDGYGWNPLMIVLGYKDPEIIKAILSQIDKLEYRTQKEIWKHYRDWRHPKKFGDDIDVQLLARQKLFDQNIQHLTPQEAVVILNSDIDKSAIFTHASQKNKSQLIKQLHDPSIDLSNIVENL